MSEEKKLLAEMQKMNYYEAVQVVRDLELYKTTREKRDRRLRRLYRSFQTTAKNHKTTVEEILRVGRDKYESQHEQL